MKNDDDDGDGDVESPFVLTQAGVHSSFTCVMGESQNPPTMEERLTDIEELINALNPTDLQESTNYRSMDLQQKKRIVKSLVVVTFAVLHLIELLDAACVVYANECITNCANMIETLGTTTSLKRKRKGEVLEKKPAPGDRFLLETYSDNMFKARMRVSRATFRFICQTVAPFFAKQDTHLKKAIPLEKRVCIALYRLATGDKLKSIAELFGVSTALVQGLVLHFCDAVKSTLHELYVRWPSKDKMERLAEGFGSLKGVESVIGAVDCSHIPIVTPSNHALDYFNRHGFHSILLQMVVSPRCVVWDYDVGWGGRLLDWTLLQRTALGQRCHKGDFDNYCLVGDCAYPPRSWMLAPYKGESLQELSREKYHWNFVHSFTRIPAERAIGMLKARFKILLKRIDMRLCNVPLLVSTCLVLHNLCILHDDGFDISWVEEAEGELQSLKSGTATSSSASTEENSRAATETLEEIQSTILDSADLILQRAQIGKMEESSYDPEGQYRQDELAESLYTKSSIEVLQELFGDSIME